MNRLILPMDTNSIYCEVFQSTLSHFMHAQFYLKMKNIMKVISKSQTTIAHMKKKKQRQIDKNDLKLWSADKTL